VIDSSFAYCVPTEDWKRETIYLKARGVDYKAKLSGCESPVEWYGQFPQLIAAREEH
jgi:hypothetical protein